MVGEFWEREIRRAERGQVRRAACLTGATEQPATEQYSHEQGRHDGSSGEPPPSQVRETPPATARLLLESCQNGRIRDAFVDEFLHIFVTEGFREFSSHNGLPDEVYGL